MTEPRTCCVTEAIAPRARAAMGSVTDDSQPVKDSVIGMYPVALNQPRLIAKISTR